MEMINTSKHLRCVEVRLPFTRFALRLIPQSLRFLPANRKLRLMGDEATASVLQSFTSFNKNIFSVPSAHFVILINCNIYLNQSFSFLVTKPAPPLNIF